MSDSESPMDNIFSLKTSEEVSAVVQKPAIKDSETMLRQGTVEKKCPGKTTWSLRQLILTDEALYITGADDISDIREDIKLLDISECERMVKRGVTNLKAAFRKIASERVILDNTLGGSAQFGMYLFIC